MTHTRAAHRYALALLGAAEERKQLEAVSKDMTMLLKAMTESRDLVIFLKSPIVNKAKKRIVLDELLKNKVTETTYQFIQLITSKERETILPEIIQEFAKLHDQRLGILRATVKSAVQFSKKQQEELAARIHAVTNKTVEFNEVIDPCLIGGFTVQYGDTVWDGSVLHQLDSLRRRFSDGAAV